MGVTHHTNTGGITLDAQEAARRFRQLPTKEQQADKLWSDSCQEIRAEMPRLRAMFARHQKAIEEGAKFGRQCSLDMDEETKRYWQEFQVQRLVEAERAKA